MARVRSNISHRDPSTTKKKIRLLWRKRVSNAGGSSASLEILNCVESSDMQSSWEIKKIPDTEWNFRVYKHFRILILLKYVVQLTVVSVELAILGHSILTHYQTRNFRLFYTERVCRRQFQIWRKWQTFIQTGRKHCGKRRNCSSRAISPFSTVFSKGLFPRGVKRCRWFIEVNKIFCFVLSAKIADIVSVVNQNSTSIYCTNI